MAVMMGERLGSDDARCSRQIDSGRMAIAPAAASVGDGWAIITEFALPAPNRFVCQITTFVRGGNGCWRRDDETHHNVLIDTAGAPARLAAHGVQVTVASAFGENSCPPGCVC
jgi:hypothetical protein